MPLASNNLAVVHIVSSLNIGGAERFVLDLCQIQQPKLANVAIMSLGEKDEPLQQLCETLDIQVFNVNGSRLKKWVAILNILKKFDILHCHSPYPLKLMSVLLPFLRSKKLIYTRHGANPLSHKSWVRLHCFLEKFVDKITFVSREGADVFQSNHGWLKHDKNVIDNGVNLATININRENPMRLRLGSVGRMVSLKNQINLLEAVALLDESQQQAVELHFYGDGPCLDSLTLASSALIPQAKVYFHGMVNNRDTIYNSFDVLVVTSETEGLSLAIIEAMAYECAVIATHVGGNPKLVEHNKNGWLFDYNDAKHLAKYISQMLTEQTLVPQFGHEGKLKISQQFSLENSAAQYQKLYES